MEQEEIKRKLFGLWEKTTHTSKELISNLFEYYFDINYLEYKELDGKILCALCGIPYTFGFGEKKLRGLYILSLSSEEGFRKKGNLSELLNKFNHKFEKEFDFTFLRPQTELLADYFGTQGYFSSFYILEERFTPLHVFKNDYLLSLTESDERIKELKIHLLEEITVTDNESFKLFPEETIIDFIKEIEAKSSSAINLNHTDKDLEYILQENTIRHLFHYISYDTEGKITGVAFIHKEEIKRIRVVAFYVTDSCSYYALLDHIKNEYSDYSISVNTSDPKYQIHSIIQQTYASANPNGGDLDNTFSTVEIPYNTNKLLQPLGMIKILRFDRILNFLAETRSDVDFKLHIRDLNTDEKENDSCEFSDKEKTETENKTVFKIRNGKCIIEKYDNFSHNPSILNLTKKEVTELLLRKNDSSNLIMEAFGIPRMNFQMRLLPC